MSPNGKDLEEGPWDPFTRVMIHASVYKNRSDRGGKTKQDGGYLYAEHG